jgi:hypothetical protein
MCLRFAARTALIIRRSYHGDPIKIKLCAGHRRGAAARGPVRVEVLVPKKDAGLIRALAKTLRGETEAAEALRLALAKAVMAPELSTAFDVFGSELADDAVTGVFEQHEGSWRKVYP